jgi:hypothetical protein
VLLLTGFLTTILLRVLKNDFLKYTRDDEMGEAEEETGWKYLHGDVFRWVGCGGWWVEQGSARGAGWLLDAAAMRGSRRCPRRRKEG